MKKVLKLSLFIVALVILLFATFLAYMSISDFQPKEKIELLSPSEVPTVTDTSFNMLIWNIGYAGLGDDMDFFYDGGTQVRTSKERTIQNLSNISRVLSSQPDIDFFLLQEVDVKAKRTYDINLRDSIEALFPNYLSLYADNYLVDYVPVPIKEPMGSVKAGLQLLSKPIPSKSTRYAFPGNFSWPTSLFMLDRCFIANRYSLKNGKELVVINTHNSAFDDGSLKEQQLNYLKAYLKQELEAGNYFVVGGDWNQTPPNFDNSKFGNYANSQHYILSSINPDVFPKDWQWAFDPSTPTNRSNVTVYKKGTTSTSVIDYYLLSPNITINDVKTIDLDFQNSDHQPVLLNFSLN